ncbi:zinc finger CCHC domain-containing protein 7, partial [Protopterus annectens]|uniref:zinc finger CCHC domain-containing protein 7 n=1 Tax=Protopterus annectens TaxID=7888 RepID=UPI001CFA08D4
IRGIFYHKRGKSDVEWSIGEKDREAQIINATGGRRAYRYYTTDKKIRCRNCDKHGHLSKDCPTPKKSPVCCLCGEKDHFQNSCPERPCSNCSLPGHFYRECIERPYWKKHCHRCEMAGHYADACPETWRQYHITVTPGSPVRSRIQPTSKKKGYCYNCAQKGHYGHECVEKRMTPWILPTSPFVYSYDNEYSIAKREKRIYRKIQELCEAGLWELPLAAKRPRIENNCTTEPLTKKKKKKKKKRSRGMCKGLKEEKYKPDKKKNARQVNENQKRSQRQEFLSCEGMEDAFPRGSMIRHQVVNATPQQHSNSAVLFFHGREKQRELPAITKKRRRKRMGKKAIKHESSEATDNLFLIKQRKRKRNRSQKL